MNRSVKQKISQGIVEFNSSISELDIVLSVHHFIQQQQNMHSSQVLVEHWSAQTTLWAIKHPLTNLKD